MSDPFSGIESTQVRIRDWNHRLRQDNLMVKKESKKKTMFREPTWFMSQLGNEFGVLRSVLLFQAAFIFYVVCFQGFDHFCFDELCKGLKGFLKTLIGLYHSRNFV